MYKFIRFVIANHHFSILLVLIILAYGAVSLYETKLTQDPTVPFPKVALDIFVDGASPTEIERNVLFPVEAEIRAVPDIVDIRLTAYHNYAEGVITFRYGVDPAEKAREVESAIQKIRRKLPAAMDYRAKEYVISDLLSSFLFSVEGAELEPQRLYEVAADLAAALRKVRDLKGVEVVNSEEQIGIYLDPVKMRSLGVGVDQVATAVQSDNGYTASGRLHINDRNFRLGGSRSRYQGTDDMGETRVYSADGVPVAMKGIAEIRLEPRNMGGVTRKDGHPVYFVRASTTDDINILEVSDRVQKALEVFRTALPAEVRVERVFDASDGVRTIVSSLVNNFLQGIGVLFLVLLFTVGFRSGLVISTILPLSFLTAVFLLGFTGYGIQQMTIAGFIIALGLLVDNGIVVTENAYLLQRYEGKGAAEAATMGAGAAFLPLLSSTLTTMLAFVPIFLLTSDVGLYLRSMSVTIWLSLLSSLFLAVTVIALLLSRVGTLGGLGRIPNPPSILNMLIPFRDSPYRWLVKKALQWRVFTIVFFLALLVFSIERGSKLPVEIFPPSGVPYVTVNLTLSPGMDESSRNAIAEELEALVKPLDEIESVMIFSGVKTPWIDLVMDPRGDIVALLRTHSGESGRVRRLEEVLKTRLQPLKAYGDVTVSLFQYHDLTYTAPFTLKISGSDAARLNAYALQIDDTLRAVEGVDSLFNPLKGSQIGLELRFRSERAEQLGVQKSEVDHWINLISYGNEVDRFRDSRGDERPLMLKIRRSETAPLEVLQDIHVSSLKGGTVPLAEVVEPVFIESEKRVTHLKFEPSVEIDFWTKGNYSSEQVAANVMAALQSVPPPPGIAAGIGGALEKQQENFDGLGKNALFTVFIIFAIFVLQFRSFVQPFIVLSAVPLCVIGALLGLVVTGETMTFMAAIGITSLMGIVVNDSILLVEEANLLLTEHPEMSVKEASAEASRKRFMPVLLTSLTTIVGLMPMAMGDSMFKTMAIAICGGLFSSTLLVLFLVPALYSFLSPRRSSEAGA